MQTPAGKCHTTIWRAQHTQRANSTCCPVTLQQNCKQDRKQAAVTPSEPMCIVPKILFSSCIHSSAVTRSACNHAHAHLPISTAGEYPRRVIMSYHASIQHRSHRLPLSTPYPVFWAASWVYAVAERIAAMKPAPMRIAELSNHYITSQVRDTATVFFSS
jgi:hypothetical protein